MNHRPKFDATSFILAGEIRDRTNKQKQAVTDAHLARRHVWMIFLPVQHGRGAV